MKANDKEKLKKTKYWTKPEGLIYPPYQEVALIDKMMSTADSRF